MGQKRLSGSIALSKLKHVVMTKKNKKGKKIEGVFIPIDLNYITRGKEGALYLNLAVVVKDEQDQYGQNGFISHQSDSETYKKLKEKGGKKFEEIQKLPILGNIKDFSSGGSSSNDASGSAGSIDENDDLPF